MSWGTQGDNDGGGGGDIVASNFHEAGALWGGGDTGGVTNDFGIGGAANEQMLGSDANAPRGGRGGCFNCGEEGHNKSDCPMPTILRCRHCNEAGHRIRDCPDPTCPPQEEREFTGECRLCGKEGHRAADCPDRPPVVCGNCKEEGHQVLDCKNPRAIDRSHIADVDADTAWDMIAAAAKERDMDDVRDAIQKYLKSQPSLTYLELETAFRSQGIEIYIIAVEKPSMLGALTNMDLQGNLDKKYQVTYRFDKRPARAREAPNWPKDEKDNEERLKDAGEPVNRGLMKCNNCDEYGHLSRACPQEKTERDQVVVKCFNCNEEGHRVRDCPVPRIDKFACKNCGQPGHKVAECPEPPNLANIECRKCSEKGHFSRDCPQGGGGGGACHNCGKEGHRSKECTEEKRIICRNCDAEGHVGRDCPKPRDYSRVKCSNCGQMGHTKTRCKEPVQEDAEDTRIGGDVVAGLEPGDAGFVAAGNGLGGGFDREVVMNDFGSGEASGAFEW